MLAMPQNQRASSHRREVTTVILLGNEKATWRIGLAMDREPATPPRRGPDPNRVYRIKTAGSPTKGPASAAVTIAEFSDFQ